ncbi:MAG: Atxe2 family lasso peptide isopeptidase [Allosphingosinicella sp.]|uniref:Atxe2 family lasso peptide isopeptidase n=1 Tax=Allosphingosinicella sp. TaxID=2823234 RepID=UPI0039514BC5
MRLLPLVVLAACAAVPHRAAAGTASCEDILPPERPTASAPRALEPEDLVRLRDIGPVDPLPHAQPFMSVSPDGSRIAFQLRRADPAGNQHCLAMAVLGLAPGARPALVDRGGELILLTIDLRGIADSPTGIPMVITPRWSPDGRWIAFLKREGGVTQVWRAEADGSGSRPLTRSPADVVDFRIGSDGSTLVFASRPALAQAYREIEQEGRTGFHYDDRFVPVAGNRPFPLSPVPRSVEVLDLASGNVREPAAGEAELLEGSADVIATAGAPARNSPDARLWISATMLTGGARKGSLHARLRNGTVANCQAPECEGAYDPWWMPGGRRVRFFRLEGWGRGSTAIYEWIPAERSVRRLYTTDDVLADCAPDGETLLCLRDASLRPRRLERLDPVRGTSQLLFDPNPEFAKLSLGAAERLRWTNSNGLEPFADLILPVGYRAGKRYPMIVVQYDTRGFLRGGTGDEYPIQAFANRGYAVLSLRRPAAVGFQRSAPDFDEANRLNLAAFEDRRSVHASLVNGVRIAVERGIADPERIGITGLSDGASTTIWGLLHSSMFRAAAVSTCCTDTTLASRVGPLAGRQLRATGYPGMLERDDPFWREISLSVNARRFATPLLMQLSDDEYLSSIESFAALREAGAPAVLFVFPDEHHVKWQPAHRLAVYRRSLDWFDFWLRGIRSSDPDREKELRHWEALKLENASRAVR